MTDRALGRMTMRRNTPRIKRRLQRSDRVAVTYTAQEIRYLLDQERKEGRKDAERARQLAEILERRRADRQ
ncbi:hypothetical protein BOWSER_63 [Gordonia phage Bowser]|uniref:Uncharacterized protein n=1 Tax=Gordonia phage Bowser TaxID=1838063 RepID=A0A160DCQ8_9CAUD|nr:hypothetical protein BH770_gp63 [Gordonia phage Bowser]ANA85458.1 hypothetical protein BOWSER_63 [Gordonia phage Bowser]